MHIDAPDPITTPGLPLNEKDCLVFRAPFGHEITLHFVFTGRYAAQLPLRPPRSEKVVGIIFELVVYKLT